MSTRVTPGAPPERVAGSAGDPPPGDGREAFIWSLTLREGIFLAMIAALIFLGKYLFRVPVHIPGRSGVLWIALMVVGRGLVRRRGAGVLMGLVAGVLVTFAVPGKESVFQWTKYVVAGAIVDLVAELLGGDLETWWKAALAGACAHVGKLATDTLVGLVLGVPLDALATILGVRATTHVVFGGLGGVLGALVLTLLQRGPVFGRRT